MVCQSPFNTCLLGCFGDEAKCLPSDRSVIVSGCPTFQTAALKELHTVVFLSFQELSIDTNASHAKVLNIEAFQYEIRIEICHSYMQVSIASDEICMAGLPTPPLVEAQTVVSLAITKHSCLIRQRILPHVSQVSH